MSKLEIRLAGSGGQGVILASVILAEAAIQAGKYTAQSQSYGPEARGGSCKAETLISDEPIGFTKVQSPDFLMVLTQKSLDTYTKKLSEDCLILIDESLPIPEDFPYSRVIRLPVLQTAKEKVGRLQTANIVAIGAINELLHLTDRETIEKAVLMHIPAGTEEINRIHEYQAKELLGSYGAPVPGGVLGETPGEIEKAAKALIETSGRCVLKAQVHSGGRGKAGGVKVAGSLEEAVLAAEAMLGMKLVTRQTGPEGKIVRKILVTEAVDVEKEFYVSVTTDSEKAGLMLILSAEGGTEIEETARLHPEKIEQIPVSVTEGLKNYECIQAAKALGLTGQTEEELADLLKKMVRLFMEKDCSLIEINPLVETRQGHLLCLDAKINFDDNALYRHPKYGLNYIRLDGNIGCLVNGAGLAMATMDMIGHYGARPANFLDVGGSASVEKVTAAFEILLSDSHVKAILVNIFGGIMKCDVIAEGIVQAARVVSLHVPLVVRLEGTRVEEGRRILRESALPIIQASDMADGVKKAVSAAVGG